jgi:hypothetical protein
MEKSEGVRKTDGTSVAKDLAKCVLIVFTQLLQVIPSTLKDTAYIHRKRSAVRQGASAKEKESRAKEGTQHGPVRVAGAALIVAIRVDGGGDGSRTRGLTVALGRSAHRESQTPRPRCRSESSKLIPRTMYSVPMRSETMNPPITKSPRFDALIT